MRKFEQFIHAKPDDPLYLMDVCKEIGVTSRTLRFHCQEHRAIGRHPYLWLRRMTLASHRLMRAGPDATTISDIATGYGFGELEGLTVQCHTLFGEPLSETRRRPVG